MKLLITLIIATCSSLAVNAQSNNIYKRKPWEETKLKRLLEDTLKRIQAFPPIADNSPRKEEKGVYRIPLKGVYIGENGKGDELYVMQPDNMPCLVPGKKFVSNMPIAGIPPNDKSLLPLLQKGEKKAGE